MIERRAYDELRDTGQEPPVSLHDRAVAATRGWWLLAWLAAVGVVLAATNLPVGVVLAIWTLTVPFCSWVVYAVFKREGGTVMKRTDKVGGNDFHR